MGTVYVRMDRTYWLHYLTATHLPQADLQTVRMRLDPLKKWLILEEDINESCFRFFLPVHTLDTQEHDWDCTYFAYMHQLRQVLEKMKSHPVGKVKLEFRTNTLTFQGLGHPVILPIEYRAHDEKGEKTSQSENNVKFAFGQAAFASGPWCITTEFLEKLQAYRTPAIPFQVRNQSLYMLDEAISVYTDTAFSGTFPREPFLKFLQLLPLPSTVHVQISENQWIRLQTLGLNIGVDAEIRLNKPTHVFLPMKRPESQQYMLSATAVKITFQKIARILEQSYPLELAVHVRNVEDGFEMFAIDGYVCIRAILPVVGSSKQIPKITGWIQAKDIATVCEILDTKTSVECVEVTTKACKLQGITVPITDSNQQLPEYTEQEKRMEEIYCLQEAVEKADVEEYIHLLFGKVKDFAKHIEHVPGDMLHITSKAGVVDIAIDFQSLRTRKMSKRIASGIYSMSMKPVICALKAFTEPEESEATIRFTGIKETHGWFTVDFRSVRFDVWLPSVHSTLQTGQLSAASEQEPISTPLVNEMFDLTDMEGWIGLDELKQQINRIVNYVVFERQRQKYIAVKETLPSLHMCFMGNPGTGKTMTARMLGRLFKQIGVLEKGHIVEVDRQKLVGQHIGHSEANLSKYIQQALGGILFIDEAHALYKADSAKDYGHDIIHVLVKAME